MKMRMATEALKWLFKNQGPGEIAMRVVPDVGFGFLEGAMTPGDLGDKIIAGGSTALGGITGGAFLGKLGGNNQMLTQALDLAGSVGGDFGGRYISDHVQRGKDSMMGGKGQTAYERMSDEQYELMKKQAQTQVLAELGLLPAGAQSGFTGIA
jgi:hypothetical protein